jgi:hypothetical protein
MSLNTQAERESERERERERKREIERARERSMRYKAHTSAPKALLCTRP